MRIISGEGRGRRLESPKGTRTRPTSDRVRESIFNILRDTVEGRPVYDLFAGTGALGLEALSRGASRGVFVESDRAALTVLSQNIRQLRLESRAQVVAIDVFRWIRGYQPDESEPALVFVDPPYQEQERHADRFHALILQLAECLPGGSIVVVESGQALDPDVWPATGERDARHYGSTHVTFLTVPDHDTEVPPADEPEPGEATGPDHEPPGPGEVGNVPA